MQGAIATALQTIEQHEQVRILYACESGSRAWGFASQQSDYDVRFIYARPREAYLQLDMPRDVIEEKQYNGVIVAASEESAQTLQEKGYPSVLDIVGWDIFKALRLFRKCNPPLLEWLFSPIVYRELSPSLSNLRIYATQCYGSLAIEQHYFHMARGNYRQYIQGKTPVLRKKYLYVLRPLLVLLHLRQNYETQGDMPPVNMLEMLAQIELPADVRAHIMRLVAQKQAGEELGLGEHDSVLNGFIENMFVRFPRLYEQQHAPDFGLALDYMLTRILDEVS
jgi:predicted nucleotidyltransferase